ncbi:hypothetical protein ACIRPX_43710 [Streptomyces sp. NPDC101225]|uniref:hypothetical protein n=1 Tax=Streptomyces sp. NPDC101225 TaxID=3366135 RepID=UPI003808254F
MNIRRTALAALVCILILAGCNQAGHSDGAPAVPQAAPGGMPHTLVGADYNSVTLIETDVQGANITGTFDTSEITGTRVDHQHAKVTGTLHGSRVTLTLDYGLGDTALNGTLTEGKLTLRAPQPDGQIEDYVLQPSTVDDYNHRVAQLQASTSATPTPSKSFY